MSVIAALLLGEAPDVAFGAAKAAYKAFIKEDSLGRLLVVLQTDFGKEADLQWDVFKSWRTDHDFCEFVREVFAGERSAAEPDDVAALAALIAPHLLRTPPESVEDLAHRMAEAALKVAPRIVEGGGEATQLLAGRLDGTEGRILRAIENLAADQDAPSDLAGALVVGPLVHIGAIGEVEAAERRAAEGEQILAAEQLLGVVEQLEAQRLWVAGESLKERAATLLAGGGEVNRAVALLVDVADARVARGSKWAVEAVSKTVRAIGGPEWIADGLEARVLWPERPQALEQLKNAAEQSSDTASHTKWLAAYVDLLFLHGKFQDIVDATPEVCTSDHHGDGLMISLDRLEAVEFLSGPAAVEQDWQTLLRALDQVGDHFDAALAYQRRGVVLTRREDLPGAEDAYRRAIGHWSSVPGYEEQAADALFSMQAAFVFNARIDVPDQDLRPLAAALRGDSVTPVAQADQLVAEGMSLRLRGDLPDARQAYWLAYAIQRRAGSLAGLHASGAVLAELYEHADERIAALSLYLDVGNGKKAAEMAAGLAPEVLTDCLGLRLPRWERAAVYHVIAQVGRTLPAVFVATIVKQLLDEAKGTPDAFVAPQPVAGARGALGAVALACPPELLNEVFVQLRDQLWAEAIDTIRSSALALILAANAGLTDDIDDLVRLYLSDPYNMGVDPQWIAQRASESADLAERLISEAAGGNAGALQALAMTDLIAGNPDLRERCSEAVRRAAEMQTVTEKRSDGMVETSFAMGIHLETPGVLARYADDESRAGLVSRIMAMLDDRREPEDNRASGVGAIFNMAATLSAEQASEIADVLEPIALGRYALSPMDKNDNHPLSRWQISLHIPNRLRTAALTTLARIAASHPEVDRGRLQDAVVRAAADGPESVLAAALRASALVPEITLPFAPESALASASIEVRRSALDAWRARNDGLPSGQMLAALQSDPDTHARVELLETAAASTEPASDDVLQALSADPDSYVRALARRRLRER